MKRIKRVVLIVAIGLTCGIYESNAQAVLVKTKPHHKHIVRMASPNPQYVWIEEEWTPSNGTYIYSGDRWAMPPSPGQRWVPGHWRSKPNGFVWEPGRWR